MNRWERHELILRAAGERGMVYLARAAHVTGASLATIRRDFEELARGGAAERIRGGLRVVRMEGNLPFATRKTQRSVEKLALAQRAVSLLQAGMVVFIDGGTTTYHLGLCLPPIPLRIITNSLRLAALLDDPGRRHPSWEVYLTGGFLQPGSSLLAGPGTVHSLGFYHADIAFLSVGGITVDGLYNTSEVVVETERTMIERAGRAVVIADYSKIGKRAMCRICGLDAIDVVITNDHPDSRRVGEQLESAGLRIERVPT